MRFSQIVPTNQVAEVMKMSGCVKGEQICSVFLPFNGYTQAMTAMFDGQVPMSVPDFLYTLLKHLRIHRRNRGKFYLSMQLSHDRERIVNMDEDLAFAVKTLNEGQGARLYLKESV